MRHSRIWIFISACLLAGSALVHAEPLEVVNDQAECRPEEEGMGVIETVQDGKAAADELLEPSFLATPYLKSPSKRECLSPAVLNGKGHGARICWYPVYNDYANEVIPEDSPFIAGNAPMDIVEVCPNYDKLDKDHRRAFWLYFLQAVAAVESGFDKTKHTPEKWRTYRDEKREINIYPGDPRWDKGKAVYSDGLFQLSTPNCASGVKAVEGMKLDWRKGIRDPKKNIQCAIGHLRKQMFDGDGGPLFSDRSHWAVLRKLRKYEGSREYPSVNSCLRKIPGYKRGDLSGIPEEYWPNIAGCQGVFGRRVLSQFWEGYPGNRRGMNLCGLKNHLDFCGTLRCGEIKADPKRAKR